MLNLYSSRCVMNKRHNRLVIYQPLDKYMSYLLRKLIPLYVIFIVVMIVINDHFHINQWENCFVTFIGYGIIEIISPNSLINSYLYFNEEGIYVNIQGNQYYRGFLKKGRPDYPYDEIGKWAIIRESDYYTLIIYDLNHNSITFPLYGDSMRIEQIRRQISEMIPILGE